MAINRNYPSPASTTSTAVPSRADVDLSAFVTPTTGSNYAGALEGTYYHASNATLATGIAGHAAPVVADNDTKALLHVFNGSAFTLIPDYLQLEVTAAGTAGTLHYTTIYIDNKGSTALTGGGTTITPVATRSTGASAAQTGLIMTFGAAALTMSSSVKVGQQIVREVIPVVQDTMFMKFGSTNAGYHAALTTAATATCHTIQHFGPIAVLPGGNLNIAQIRPSQSAAASYQFSFGFWLR